jgi:hypothetical protein
MDKISLSAIFKVLELHLKKDEWDKLEVHAKNFEQCVSLLIDGEMYISTLSFWPNGLCDIDSIEVSSEIPEFKHFEFNCDEEAAETILSELRNLIVKSGKVT